ncbi:MAG: UDP-3-O-(3-hydroxymyristoyl)glucosamine N-acyltransferase [Chlamydiae bacterium RIFCSPHIGHO2_12_FULL_49_11]|nr:MAG: UDP-3-O-(3-hydroxymyristoyl)glucosamine N-acyltransferase [Chlamydiae bacterium RIFCSPHIGHO2_12_FULL_49_11]
MGTAAYTLDELARKTGAALVGNPEHLITGVDDLESATESDASFLANAKYAPLMKKTRAGVVCARKEDAGVPGLNYLISPHPSQTFQILIELFLQKWVSGFTGIHPDATIHPETQIHYTVCIGPHTTVDRFVTIGERTVVGANVSIGPGTMIGKGCTIHPNVTIREGVVIKDRVILQPGAVIGSCGFGYITDEKNGTHAKIDHRGGVVIEDDVEIGAGTTIDRGRFKPTRICKGVKIDNLCMIGHNVEVGENTLVVAQVGVAGSTKVGKNVILAGQAGLAGHLKIADGVVVTAQSGVSKSLTVAGIYRGSPAVPLREFQKLHHALCKLQETGRGA